MKEIWKTINEYPNYQVSNTGKVKSIERKVKKWNGYRTVRERILNPINNKGYQQVTLCRDGKIKPMLVHRLVVQAFLPNPYNLPEVNHLDEDKTNNNVENLEWCTREYNNNYGTHNERIAKSNTNNIKLSKKVLCIETNTIYHSTIEVERQFGFANQNIGACCNGKLKSAYGFHWKYVD